MRVSEEKLSRFARGELSPAESRELAQKALDNEELFDELTWTAVARTALRKGACKKSGWPRIALFAAAAAAVVTVLLSLYAIQQFRRPPSSAVAMSGAPAFLGRGLEDGPRFRGADPESREPKATGSVTNVSGGIVTIDLGSLDGLEKNADVQVVRGGNPIGEINLTAIFRERARATAPAGIAIRVNDQIRVPPALYLRAVLDRIDVLSSRGDQPGARRIAQSAANASWPAPPENYYDLNNLGGIADLRGDKPGARTLYERALRANPSPDARRAIETNLARVGNRP